MNELQILNFEEKEIGSINQNNDTWFVAKDICDVLEIKNVTDFLKKLDEDEKLTYKISRAGQTREMNFINEFGLYNLILSSNKPEAKQFKRWVTHEVLPTIRKTGKYEINKMSNPNQLLLDICTGNQFKDMLEKQANSMQVKEGFAFHDDRYVSIDEIVERFPYPVTSGYIAHQLDTDGVLDLQSCYRGDYNLVCDRDCIRRITEKGLTVGEEVHKPQYRDGTKKVSATAQPFAHRFTKEYVIDFIKRYGFAEKAYMYYDAESYKVEDVFK